ncbi:MAG: glycosyltransferase family 9 protein [Planctomycetota bacterium]|jgi:lipopolysaccharide heptosyltransferase I
MKTTDYTNILIIKPSALGDIVHALPVLSSLRAAFPQAKLTWLVRKEFAPLLECVEGLNEALLFDRKGMGKWFYHPKGFKIFWNFTKQLRAGGFDLVLDLQGLFRSAIFSRMTGCSTRIGMEESREFSHLFYTQLVNRPAESVHILDTYFEVLKDIGIQSCSPHCRLAAPAAAQDSVRQKLETAQLTPKKFLVLVPGAAHTYKCWPPEQFAKLAEIYHQRHGWKAVVVGTQNDSIHAKTIQANATSPVIDLTGQTSVPELVALFDEAGATVSNDTGPGHIALATETPGVVIFGNTNPLRLGPYQRPECIAAIDIESRGIEIKDTKPAHQIENVTIEMVLKKISSQLAE